MATGRVPHSNGRGLCRMSTSPYQAHRRDGTGKGTESVRVYARETGLHWTDSCIPCREPICSRMKHPRRKRALLRQLELRQPFFIGFFGALGTWNASLVPLRRYEPRPARTILLAKLGCSTLDIRRDGSSFSVPKLYAAALESVREPADGLTSGPSPAQSCASVACAGERHRTLLYQMTAYRTGLRRERCLPTVTRQQTHASTGTRCGEPIRHRAFVPAADLRRGDGRSQLRLEGSDPAVCQV